MTIQPYSPKPPFAATSGPRDAKIALVAEAWGKDEAILGRPLVGASGQEFNRMLTAAGLDRKDCFATNLISFRPVDNDFGTLCGKKAEVGGNDYPYPAISHTEGYLKPEYFPELERLKTELEEVKPNLVIALGAKASWALLQNPGIKSIRGVCAWGLLVNAKILPTWHPAAVLRAWDLRTICIADLMKAKSESQFPDLRRPVRQLLVAPTIPEIQAWTAECLAKASIISCDIETRSGFIKSIAFSWSPSNALCIPFLSPDSHSLYFDTLSEEIEAWICVRALLESPIPKLGQNFLYDLQYLIRAGIRVRNFSHDTMLQSHSRIPEMTKDLGFLGSIFTDEASWKLLRRAKTTKKDD